MKQIGEITSAERGSLVTLLHSQCCWEYCSTCMIFSRKHSKNGATTGTTGVGHSTGWMTKDNVLVYVHHFVNHVKCSNNYPGLVLIDNHESH